MKILIALQALTLGGVAWLALRPAPTPPDPSAAIAARGAELLAADRFAAAAIAYERAATVASPDAALGLLDKARHAEAMALIARADLPPAGDAARLAALADTLEAAGDPVAPLLRVVMLRSTGRLSEASTLAEGLVEQQPWARWHLGAIRLREARVEDAIKALEAVAKAHPTFGAAKHQLGLAYATKSRNEAAIQALQEAIQHGAGHVAQLDLGRLFLKREMWAEALPHLENSLRARPADAEVIRLIAAAHFHLKRHELAAKTYQRAYALEPAPRTLLSAAIAWQAAKKPAVALNLLDALAPRVAELPEILFQRALVLTTLKRPVRPVIERYLMFARGVPSEAERVKQAEAFLKGPPSTPGPVPPAPAAARSAPAPAPR